MAEKKEKRYVSDNARLMEEWDWEKNNELNLVPNKLTLGSNKRAFWKCVKGHKWSAIIANRGKGNGCPYCAGQRTIKGENDLQTVNPTLAKEWNYDKNHGLTPMDVMPSSGKKVWWQCVKGHEWQATVESRNYGRGCPMCNSERRTSFPEYALMFYLQKYGIEVIHTYSGQGYELDIYIPAKRIGIEFDGYYWHKNKTKQDLEKNSRCRKDEIKLYRIREGLIPLNDSSMDYVIRKDHKDLSKTVGQILSEIAETVVEVNIERDALAIENLRDFAEKNSSILFANSELAIEWNYSKNGKLKPENFLPNSNKKVWWRCSKRHEWQAKICSRTAGNGCPYCAGHYVVEGENDLLTINPTLAKEWNHDRNGDLKPENFTANSGEKVWWRCDKGHEWGASITARNKGSGCPYCLGRYVIKGKNDLQTINPTLAKEWNYEKNIDLKPTDILPNSGIKVWWKCTNGHEWPATLNHRSQGRGCPYCAGKKVLKGFNDLQTTNPALIMEWDYEKNGNQKPDSVTKSSSKKIWWKCVRGHEWQAPVGARNQGRGCPYCASQKILKGYNDLQTLNPALAEEWNYEMNTGLTPSDVMPNSNKKVWWKCRNGHEWQALISNRNKGSGCPVCRKKH